MSNGKNCVVQYSGYSPAAGPSVRAPRLSLRHPGYAEYQPGRPWPVVRADRNAMAPASLRTQRRNFESPHGLPSVATSMSQMQLESSPASNTRPGDQACQRQADSWRGSASRLPASLRHVISVKSRVPVTRRQLFPINHLSTQHFLSAGSLRTNSKFVRLSVPISAITLTSQGQ
jgi:hypothetical protein